MSDIAVRLAVVGGALAVALLAMWLIQRRASGPIRRMDSTGLPSGVYFFSSTACDSCGRSRKELIGALGEAGFVEHGWEENPGLFADLGVVAVPAVLVVDETGRGTLFPGKAKKALASLRSLD